MLADLRSKKRPIRLGKCAFCGKDVYGILTKAIALGNKTLLHKGKCAKKYKSAQKRKVKTK